MGAVCFSFKKLTYTQKNDFGFTILRAYFIPIRFLKQQNTRGAHATLEDPAHSSSHVHTQQHQRGIGSRRTQHPELNTQQPGTQDTHTVSPVTEVYYGIIYVPVIAEKAVPSEAGSGVQPSWVGQRSQVGEKSTR